MKIYLIRLKDFPFYVGKQNPSYAMTSDLLLNIKRDDNMQRGRPYSEEEIIFNGPVHSRARWFVEREKAKIFTTVSSVRTLRTRGRGNYEENPTFSRYVLEIDDNGVIEEIPLDNI